MILYTVVPEAFVLAGLGQGIGDAIWWLGDGADTASAWGGTPSATRETETTVAGARGPVRLVLRRDAWGTWRINRLLSSDPHDYLNPVFEPGQPADGPDRAP